MTKNFKWITLYLVLLILIILTFLLPVFNVSETKQIGLLNLFHKDLKGYGNMVFITFILLTLGQIVLVLLKIPKKNPNIVTGVAVAQTITAILIITLTDQLVSFWIYITVFLTIISLYVLSKAV